MAEIDFALGARPQEALQPTPDFVGQGLLYQNQGIKDRQAAADQQRQTQLRGALAGYAANPNAATIAPVLPLDPQLGMQLQQNQADIASQGQQDTSDAAQAQAQQQAEHVKRLKSAGQAVQSIYETNGGDMKAAWDTANPILSQLFPAENLQQFQDATVAKPSALKAFIGELDKTPPYRFIATGTGAIGRGNERTGEFQTVFQGPKYEQFDPDKPTYDVSGGAPMSGTGQPQPMGGAAPQAPAGGLPAGATRGDRNNNPFNVKTPPQGPWQGQTGVDQFGHAIFADPANGMRAGDLNLQAYAKHGITTPEAFVDRYAGEATPQVKANYVASIRSAVGDHFDLSDAQTRQAITPAILHSEGTHMPGGGQPPAQGAPQQQAGGPRLVIPAQSPQTGDDGRLNEDAIQQLAEAFSVNRVLPALGMGKIGAQNRADVLNRSAAMERATGKTGADAVVAAAGFRAASGALNQTTKQSAAIESFEQTARANSEIVRSLLTKGSGGTNSPLLNRPLRFLRGGVLGDADITALDAARQTYASEVSKINSGNTGAAGATDAVRRETERMLSPDATPAQILASMRVLDQDMSNRSKSLRDQIEIQRKALTSGNLSQSGAPNVASVAPQGQGGKPYAPGTPFSLAQPQQQAFREKLGGSTRGMVGERSNPIFINPSDPRSSLGNVKNKQWYVNEYGELLKRGGGQ